jgi:hypothetical protein
MISDPSYESLSGPPLGIVGSVESSQVYTLADSVWVSFLLPPFPFRLSFSIRPNSPSSKLSFKVSPFLTRNYGHNSPSRSP